MNRTTKKIAQAVAAIAILIGASNVNAQTQETKGDSKDVRLGIGFNAGLPLDDFYKVALGGDIRLQKDFFSNISATLSAGYTHFSFTDELQTLTNKNGIGYIPVKLGIKIFPVENFCISGEAGAAFGAEKGQSTVIVYAPGIGYGFNNGIDLGLRYEGFAKDGNNLAQVALRIAYGFNLSK